MPKITSWTRHGELIDRRHAEIRAEQSRPAQKTVAQRRKKREGEARARMLHQGRSEAEFEAEMDERIKTIGAEIRAENLQRMLDVTAEDTAA